VCKGNEKERRKKKKTNEIGKVNTDGRIILKLFSNEKEEGCGLD
jgi:hypothetical protein